MPTDTPYSLTPADVQTLRDSIAWRAVDHAEYPAVPFIVWSASERGYILHAYRRPMALSVDPAPLLACLRCERHEPGFIRRIMDRSEPCDLASLSPDLAAVERAKAATEARRQAEGAQARAQQAARLAAMQQPQRLDLDDFV